MLSEQLLSLGGYWKGQKLCLEEFGTSDAGLGLLTFSYLWEREISWFFLSHRQSRGFQSPFLELRMRGWLKCKRWA